MEGVIVEEFNHLDNHVELGNFGGVWRLFFEYNAREATLTLDRVSLPRISARMVSYGSVYWGRDLPLAARFCQHLLMDTLEIAGTGWDISIPVSK
jgi:hypothetical protein